MVRLIVILYLLSFSLYSMTLNDWESRIVKITSSSCSGHGPVYEGSGVILQDNEIVTSEHVLLPNNLAAVCYMVYNDKIGEQKAELLRNDFYNGLAHLRFTTINISVDDSNQVMETNDLVIMGYPVGSRELKVIDSAKLSSATLKRSFTPALNAMYEVVDAPVVLGMSGGIILGEQNGKPHFDALLSHKIKNNNRAMGLPADHVNDWVMERNKPQINTWQRQINKNDGSMQLSLGPLEFISTKIDSAHLNALGGADGSGVGGQKVSVSKDMMAFKISLNRDEIKDDYSFKRPLLKKWYEWLLRGEKLIIFQTIDDENNVEFIRSFDELVERIENDGVIPLVLRSRDDQAEELIDDLFVQIHKTHKILFNLVSQENSSEVDLWLKNILHSLVLVENLIINTDESSIWSERNTFVWDELYLNHFEQAILLENSLYLLKAELSYSLRNRQI